MPAASAAALTPADFAGYPPLARALAQGHLDTLRSLPVPFAAVFLRELIRFDWQFPAERAETTEQLALLAHPDAEPWKGLLARFAALPLSPELESFPWAAQPESFVEKLTAYLWSVHSMDAFHEAATRYGEQLNAARAAGPDAPSRLCIVLVGRDAPGEGRQLFTRLRPYGTSFGHVDTTGAFGTALDALRARAAAHPEPYAHWLLSGAEADPLPGISTVSWNGVAPLRRQLLSSMDQARTSGTVGPEDLRSLMARLRPEDIAPSSPGADTRLQHFALSLLTEGSGTQIFSTTFVQWAARETLRRARPRTLLVRYSSRQADRPMNDLLASGTGEASLDPRGSLIDAEMGAFYTWINLGRLPGADRARFIVCHEGGQEAVAVSPGMAAGTASTQSCSLKDILRWTQT